MTRQSVQPDYPKTLAFKDLIAGTVLEGVYKGSKEFKASGNRITHVYNFKSDGDEFGVFAVAALDARMTKVPVGAYTWITYHGKVKSANGERHDVAVEFDPDSVAGVDKIPS